MPQLQSCFGGRRMAFEPQRSASNAPYRRAGGRTAWRYVILHVTDGEDTLDVSLRGPR
jgi:hypothetical protein